MADESDSLFKKFEEILAYPAVVDDPEADEEDANEAAAQAEESKELLREETGADMD